MEEEQDRVRRLRDRLQTRLLAGLEGAVNGSTENRLPNNLNMSFAGVEAAAILMKLPDVALSTGSACSSATPAPSHVLRAIGLSGEAARSSIRFGLGRFNTEEEIDFAARRVIEVVRTLRGSVPGAGSG
jgi:cysteine desulfurase